MKKQPDIRVSTTSKEPVQGGSVGTGGERVDAEPLDASHPCAKDLDLRPVEVVSEGVEDTLELGDAGGISNRWAGTGRCPVAVGGASMMWNVRCVMAYAYSAAVDIRA